jgi:hypothetical protein
MGNTVSVQGIISSKTREPMVNVVNEDGNNQWQMNPAQARHFAMTILDSAVEAERDAATFAFLTSGRGSGMEFTDEDAGNFLAVMRDHRKDWVEDFKKASLKMDDRPTPPGAL